MAKSIEVKRVRIGEGLPKICVPIIGRTRQQIENEAKEISLLDTDMIEWRIDYFVEGRKAVNVNEMLGVIKSIVKQPIILTFRTSAEGGQLDITPTQYQNLYEEIIGNGKPDMIDIEWALQQTLQQNLCMLARENNVVPILSNHDFQKTPAKETLLRRFFDMERMGAGIAKIAAMPNNYRDVLVLMQATREASECVRIPVVSMSMGKLGVLSRVGGETSGSAITFAKHGDNSAPGQLPLDTVRLIINELAKQN